MKNSYLFLLFLLLCAPLYSMNPKVTYNSRSKCYVAACDACATEVHPKHIWCLSPCGHQCDTVCMGRSVKNGCPKCGVKITGSHQDLFTKKLEKQARKAKYD